MGSSSKKGSYPVDFLLNNPDQALHEQPELEVAGTVARAHDPAAMDDRTTVGTI